MLMVQFHTYLPDKAITKLPSTSNAKSSLVAFLNIQSGYSSI